MNANLNKSNLLKTFLQYSVPCILAMLLTSCITVVDGMFIGWKLGGKGLAAVNITIMVGVGGLTLAMHSLGGGNKPLADKRFTFTIVLNAVVNLIASVVLIVFRDAVIGFLNVEEELLPYVRDYLGIMSYFYIFIMMNITIMMFIRGEGKPQLSLMFSIIANTLNIVLDYL